MDETVIVIMLKDETTGFLEKELDSYTLAENSELIFSIYAEVPAKRQRYFHFLFCTVIILFISDCFVYGKQFRIVCVQNGA